MTFNIIRSPINQHKSISSVRFDMMPEYLQEQHFRIRSIEAKHHVSVPSICRLGFTSPPICFSLAFKICWRTASTMGITMATAEVFWTHMERKAVPDMKPSISLETTGHRHQETISTGRRPCSGIPQGQHQAIWPKKIRWTLTMLDWLPPRSPASRPPCGEAPTLQWMWRGKWPPPAGSESL